MLADSINKAISFGYSIEFKNKFVNNVTIVLRKDNEIAEQSLPLDDHHNVDRTMGECIDWMLNKVVSEKRHKQRMIDLYRDGKLLWGTFKIQDMETNHIKNCIKLLIGDALPDRLNDKEGWLTVFKNEIRLREIRDFSPKNL